MRHMVKWGVINLLLLLLYVTPYLILDTKPMNCFIIIISMHDASMP